MAAFVSRYAGAFADVVTAAKLDTAALDALCPGNQNIVSLLDPPPPLSIPATQTMPTQLPATS